MSSSADGKWVVGGFTDRVGWLWGGNGRLNRYSGRLVVRLRLFQEHLLAERGGAQVDLGVNTSWCGSEVEVIQVQRHARVPQGTVTAWGVHNA